MLQYANIGVVESRRESIVLPVVLQFAVNGAGWEDLTTKTVRARWYYQRRLVFELDASSIGVSADTIILSPDATPIQASTGKATGSTARYDAWGLVPPLPYTFRLDVAAAGQDAEIGVVARWDHQAEDDIDETHTLLPASWLSKTVTVVDSLGQLVVITISGGSFISAPSTIDAIGLDAEVIVEWSRVAGAVDYALYRDTTTDFVPAPGNLIAEPVLSGFGIEAYLDTPLVNGTTYYYVVIARTGEIESIASVEASATPQAGAGSAIVDGSGALWVDAQGRGLYTT